MTISTMTKRDTASTRSDTSRIGIGNRLKILVTSALLLAASSATPGIQFIPVVDLYVSPELAPLSVRKDSGEAHLDYFTIAMNGLTGESTIQGSDLPPAYDVPAVTKRVLPFDQDLELKIDMTTGNVSGQAKIRYYDASSPYLAATAEVSGNATCLPRNGRECGQLIVDLELQGILTNPNDPSIVGQLRIEMLGSLVWDDTHVAHWAAMSANSTIGGNEGLITSLSWGQGDFNADGTVD